MGIKNLSKKLRDSKDTPDEFSTNEILHGKNIGIDFSVVLHKGLGTNEGAGLFHAKPKCPNTEVMEKCERLCSWAKSNHIKLKVSVDGKYHPMKERENTKRQKDRELAQEKLKLLVESGNFNDENMLKKAKSLMKESAFVNDDVVAAGVGVFLEHGFEVCGAPYESDFQLVYWEKKGITDGTYTIDSDIFAMGSSMTIDLLNFNSAKGKCKILLREQVLGNIMNGSESWSTEDVILFSVLSGCDFIPRLFRLKTEEIESLMLRYKQNEHPLDELLSELADGKYWPAGNNKAGPPATDFVTKVKTCIGLMSHAPVTDCAGDVYSVVPLKPLSPGKTWSEVIGFDPITDFGESDVSIKDSYHMKLWVRTQSPLPTIPKPFDPKNPSRTLPHGAYIDFKSLPMELVPASLLRLYLYFHGVPMPKGAYRDDLLNQVKRIIDLDIPLDDERIASDDVANAKSYISCDTITILSETTWTTDGEELINAIRSEGTPRINADYINSIFGPGKNGIRERAWLRFESGHLDMDTLQMTDNEMVLNGKKEKVRIFTIKVTPSMKNVVYSVYIIFTASGIYVSKQSKCDCPNGWLLCSHLLAVLLVFYLIQKQDDWTYDDVKTFCPPPIKSLQSVPLSAQYVFGELEVSKSGSKKGVSNKKKAKDKQEDEVI